MILQALRRYYDALAARDAVRPPGWCDAPVSFALSIDQNGTLQGVIPLMIPSGNGRKEAPQSLEVPERVKRASGVCSNFLCDNGAYFLGVDAKGKPERTLQCFAAARTLHEKILSGLDNPVAHAVTAFFAAWQPEHAAGHPAVAPFLDELMKGGNLVFSVDGVFP